MQKYEWVTRKMQMTIFQLNENNSFREELIDVVEIHHDFLLLKEAKKRVKRNLEDPRLYSLYDLKIGKTILVYYDPKKENDELHVLPIVQAPGSWKTVSEGLLESQIDALCRPYEEKIQLLDELINHLITSASEQSRKEMEVLKESIIMSLKNPKFLSELKTIIIPKEGDISK